MKNLSHLLSQEYQAKNNDYINQLKQMGLDALVVYIRFNNGHSMMLSTFNTVLSSHSPLNWFEPLTHHGDSCSLRASCWFGNDALPFHTEFDSEINCHHDLHRVYTLFRHCAECDLIFICFSEQSVIEPFSVYRRTINQFKALCFQYIESFKPLMINTEISYRYAMIFQNQQYLTSVINGCESAIKKLTLKEQECLSLALLGLSFKEVAKELKISDRTVKYHCENVRKKMNAESLMGSAVMALYLGEIGCLYPDTNL